MRLPDFLIIGTAKAGTTAAMENLSRHPQIHVGPAQWHPLHGPEWHHFFREDSAWQRGLDWYASLFDSPKPLLGDKATDYLAYTVCHARIRQALPRAKLIVLLRNPVDRAYSHWNHFCRQHGNRDPQIWHAASFEETMGLLPGRTPPWYHAELKWYGHYADQLEHLFRHFPRSQVHVAIAERVLADMPGQYARMFQFLGADPRLADPSAYRRALRAQTQWPYPEPMRAESRAALEEYYRPHNQRLFRLLGEEIPEWSAG